MSKAAFTLLLCFAPVLGACGSRNPPNTIQIGDNGSGSALKLSSNGLYINRTLLDISDTNVSIHTSADNEITFDITRPEKESDLAPARGSAF